MVDASRQAYDLSENAPFHEHCIKCYNRKCEKDGSFVGFGDDSCSLIDCPSDCGVRLHRCKLHDHLTYICGNFTVPCINQVYGCPLEVVRKRLASHVEKCPASVVSCNSQWNRTLKTINDNTQLVRTDLASELADTNDILDVSLAARDQRKLDEALKMPKTLRRSLRNAFASNMPAVPLTQRPTHNALQQSNESLSTSTESLDFLAEGDNHQMEQNLHPPGIYNPHINGL